MPVNCAKLLPNTADVRVKQQAPNPVTFPNLLVLQARSAGEQMPPLPIRRETALAARRHVWRWLRCGSVDGLPWTNGNGIHRAMKFRTTTIWIALISTGMLCLAVGAVRIPRKPKPAPERPALERPATNQGGDRASVPVIPMRVASAAATSVSSTNGVIGTSTQRQPQTQRQHALSQQQRIENFDRRPPAERAAQSRFGAVGNFVAAPSSVPPIGQNQQQSGYQEPEAWPFHRKSTSSSGYSAQTLPTQGSAAQDTSNSRSGSRVDDWPYQPTAREAANPETFQATNSNTPNNWPAPPLTPQATQSAAPPTEQFPTNAPTYPSHQRPDFAATQQQPPSGHVATSNDLLNPALAFGGVPTNGPKFQPQHSQPTMSRSSYAPAQPPGQPVIANDFEITQPQHSLSRMTDPFADPSASSTSGSVAALPSQPALPVPSPSLADLPAPVPSSGQSHNVLEAGHAGSDSRVIQAYAESVTPRNYVTVGQWSGPQNRPVQSIQRVSFDACPDCEDVQRIPAESLINPYAARANAYPASVAMPHEAGQLAELPREYAPWWDEVINKPMRAAPSTRPINVESLIFEAIEHSPQVTAFRIDPIIRETQILEEVAEFDWQTFLETKFDDSNDPIGNSLTTGDNSDRFTDKHFTSRFGVEKRLEQGGSLDVTQNFGLQDNNSTFFTPRDQGTSRLELNFTQPLLRGAGQTYNESRTVLAMLDHQISEDDLQDSLQDHLVEVYTTYWNLYRARAVRLQKERLLRRAIDVEQKLAARQGIDAVRRQVLRARAAIASRRSEIARADMEVRNAESRLRLLVNSPGLKQSTVVELLPIEAPMSEYMSVSMRGSVETALQNRPDIRRAIKQMKETAVRLEVSKNELLPKLDFVLGTYVAGLRGKSQIDTAWTNQFRDGRPGYSVGLMLQYPLGNRAAKARYARREWEVARTLKEFEASVESSMSEVELAVREFETSYQEMLSRFQSMIAADTEANYLLERWRLLPGNDQTTSFLLEDLLDAQERVAMEEQDFVEAQVAYVLSVVRLKRASGILLNCDCGNSPVSFMTPVPRGIAQPKPLPQPVGQRPALPAPTPANAKLTPPLPVLPKAQTSATPRAETPQPTESSLDQPSIIPLPGQAPLPVPARSQL